MLNATNSKGLAVWLTGLIGSGKRTLCDAVAARLRKQGVPVHILDGGDLRRDLCADLGFTAADRTEHIRRIAFAAHLLVDNGVVVLVAAVTPLHSMRAAARARIKRFVEVFVDAPLVLCEAGNSTGLYLRARAGELPEFPGITGVYETPTSPDVVCHTDLESILESTQKILTAIAGFLDLQSELDSHDVNEEPSKRVLAVDFDGVIANYNGWRGRHVIGAPRQDVVDALRELGTEGWKIIIHTTRCREDIEDYLLNHAIPFDEINQNLDTPTLGVKPHANVYWDDRALRYSGDARQDLRLIRRFRTWSGRH